MPVSMGLEYSSRLDDAKIVTGPAHKLQSDGEILLRETTRNGHRRQPANIAEATERIGKDETGLKIQGQRRRWNRLCRRREHVKRLEQGIHFLLSDFSHLKSLQIIGCGILLVDVAGDLSKRISQFADATLFRLIT